MSMMPDMVNKKCNFAIFLIKLEVYGKQSNVARSL